MKVLAKVASFGPKQSCVGVRELDSRRARRHLSSRSSTSLPAMAFVSQVVRLVLCPCSPSYLLSRGMEAKSDEAVEELRFMSEILVFPMTMISWDWLAYESR